MGADQFIFSDQEYIRLTPDKDLQAEQEIILWRDFRKGDRAAYAAIYKKYFLVLYQYGKKVSNDHELVKDTIQDLFIKLWNNRENLQETTSVKYYLLASFKRKLLDTFRSPQAKVEINTELLEQDLFVVEDMEEDMQSKKEDVLQALNRLSSHQQKLLQLKFYKNLSNQEIAQEMGITIQSVYNAVFKTLKSLRNQLSILITAFLLHF